jgi:hypothetical protein
MHQILKKFLEKSIENLPYILARDENSYKISFKTDDFQRPSIVSPKKYLEPSSNILEIHRFIPVKKILLNAGLRRK